LPATVFGLPLRVRALVPPLLLHQQLLLLAGHSLWLALACACIGLCPLATGWQTLQSANTHMGQHTCWTVMLKNLMGASHAANTLVLLAGGWNTCDGRLWGSIKKTCFQ
jgi:hypothetical protein